MAYIRDPLVGPPSIPPADTPPDLQPPPIERPREPDGRLKAAANTQNTPLSLNEVIASVSQNFPLLLAIAEERGVAGGQRQVAESAFDTSLRSGIQNSEGSFGNTRVNVGFEQAFPYHGVSVFGGYRLGLGDYPIFNGDQKTGSAGEFSGGFRVPLLRDAPIDRRRAAVRQAQIGERLAEPTIQRARLDFLRAASRSYWAWAAAGERYRIQQELLKLATARQDVLEKRLKNAQNVDELTVNENRRAIADRQELLLANERILQQEAFNLSLFLRDPDGRPIVPSNDRLPIDFLASVPPAVDSSRIADDTQTAFGLRPELQRFRLLKDRAAVDLQLARNQTYPGAVAGASFSQDVGPSSKTFTGVGPFGSSRSSANLFLSADVPWQRREALGRARIAQATLNQLQLQEQFAQDSIRAEVQDAISALSLARKRLELAREEWKTSRLIVEQETRRVFVAGQSDLLLLNIREFNAATAQSKIANLIAEYNRSYADYLLALGMDAAPPPMPPPNVPAVLPMPTPPIPAVPPLPLPKK